MMKNQLMWYLMWGVKIKKGRIVVRKQRQQLISICPLFGFERWCTSTLAELCKPPAGAGSVTTVSITDVKPEIFKHMLYYIYGRKLTDEELEDNAKDIIDACDKMELWV